MTKSVGTVSQILKGSPELCLRLQAIGHSKRVSRLRFLFRTDDGNKGVFLVKSGRVALLVEGLPHLTRIFSAGSLLGLPSTFTDNPYSLTAKTVADSVIVQIPQKEFLELMSEDGTLCQQVNRILSREVSFIQRALAERRERKELHPPPDKARKMAARTPADTPRRSRRVREPA